MSKFHLGINLGHDRSAALVKDGKLVCAIEQERIDRQKHSVGYLIQAPGDPSLIQLPVEAIRYCLDAAGITINDVATITGNMPGIDHAPDIIRRWLPQSEASKVQELPSHHLAHAYSAYWPSGFEESIVLISDGSGSTRFVSPEECAPGQMPGNYSESYSLFTARGTNLELLHREEVPAHLARLSTLGFVYEAISERAGFISNVGGAISVAEAGKLMGLAPYGGPQAHWNRWLRTTPGSFHLDISAYDIFLEMAALDKRYGNPHGAPHRRPYIVDMAYKVQSELEDALVHLVSEAVERTGLRHVCLAGGVALNSVANDAIRRRTDVDDIWVFPASGDSGIAAGCAFWAYHTNAGGQERPVLRQATLGRTYAETEINDAIGRFATSVEVERVGDDAMVGRVSEALSQGSVVARWEGPSEFGPRALGHRSIMADPAFERMKDVLNARVKFREAYRPFAPVVPLENSSDVFELNVRSPFMLLVCPFREEMRKALPAVCHQDGTGRVQTVTAEDNPFFYNVCKTLPTLRDGPPVLLNTSFNVAGQPIVETPAEAIATFLSCDIDYLALGPYLLRKSGHKVHDYQEHVDRLPIAIPNPAGLNPNEPSLDTLMMELDDALFGTKAQDGSWSEDELRVLSEQGGRFVETSRVRQDALPSRLSPNVIAIVDPKGTCLVADSRDPHKSRSYSYREVRILQSAVLGADALRDTLRQQLRLTQAALDDRMRWAEKELSWFGIDINPSWQRTLLEDSTIPSASATQTLAPFEDETFSYARRLGELRQILIDTNYTADHISEVLGVEALQLIKPTHLHYYARYVLPDSNLGYLVRLFLVRDSISENSAASLFGEALLGDMIRLGILSKTGDGIKATVDLVEVDGLYLATDHRYALWAEDAIEEQPVMYIGLDSLGLAMTAPRDLHGPVLDLCCGSGIQGLVQSRHASEVVGVDINPRAIRFSRFNAQLNGVDNARFVLGSLYEPVAGKKFETILANPPFVPSPNHEYRYRDGGQRGEDILRAIVEGSHSHLEGGGRLCIVSDLVDTPTYQERVRNWWQGAGTDVLLLQTADRDEALFSVPHCHSPFGQSYDDYCAQLSEWVDNFRQAKLSQVNFGYLLFQQRPNQDELTYTARVVHSPTKRMDEHVRSYFVQREHMRTDDADSLFLQLTPGLRFTIEQSTNGSTPHYQASVNDSPYFTTYSLPEAIYQKLSNLVNHPQTVGEFCTTASSREQLWELVLLGLVSLGRSAGATEDSPAQQAAPRPAASKVAEHATKTTPTCLSSFIRS